MGLVVLNSGCVQGDTFPELKKRPDEIKEILDEEEDHQFVLLKYLVLVRGVPPSDPKNTFYFNNSVDTDMYIHATPELRTCTFSRTDSIHAHSPLSKLASLCIPCVG